MKIFQNTVKNIPTLQNSNKTIKLRNIIYWQRSMSFVKMCKEYLPIRFLRMFDGTKPLTESTLTYHQKVFCDIFLRAISQ